MSTKKKTKKKYTRPRYRGDIGRPELWIGEGMHMRTPSRDDRVRVIYPDGTAEWLFSYEGWETDEVEDFSDRPCWNYDRSDYINRHIALSKSIPDAIERMSQYDLNHGRRSVFLGYL